MRFYGAVSRFAMGRQTVERFDDQFADPLEFIDAEPARRRRGRAQPHARSDRGLLRIERNAVLVASDMRAFERRFGVLAGQTPRLDGVVDGFTQPLARLRQSAHQALAHRCQSTGERILDRARSAAARGSARPGLFGTTARAS